MKTRIVLELLLGISVFPLACGKENHDRQVNATISADELAAIPDGLSVSHEPNPVSAVLGGGSGSRYTWTYATKVTALATDITIREFGAFVWRDDRWVFASFEGRPFNADEFAEWYSCPNAVLTKGSSAVDPANWTGSNELSAGKTKWVYFGTTSTGQLVKGVSIVEHLGRIIK